MRPLFLAPRARADLHRVSVLSPSPTQRRNARVLLALARGYTVAAVARAFRLSRPTVYRLAALWSEFQDVAILDPVVSRRLKPWRK
jgi:hypothetical protein